MEKEIERFVNENFCCVHTDRIKNKARHYLKLKNAKINENYINHLRVMAKK